MFRTASFTDFQHTTQFEVVPEHVIYVESKDDAVTTIVFSGDQKISVDGKIQDVIASLEEAQSGSS